MRVLIVGSDMFFTIRIRTAARAAGVEVTEASPAHLVETARRVAPDLVIVDLHAAGDPIAAAGALKRDPAMSGVRVVGYYSHVEGALGRTAVEAGIEAMPRSAFTTRLPAMLTGVVPGATSGGPGAPG